MLMRGRRRLLLPLAAGFLAACVTSTNQSPKPPSAAEILAKHEAANVTDAHFTITAHIVSGSASLDATGDGLIVIKPREASEFTMQAVIQGQRVKFVEIITGGKEYDLSPDNPRWTVRAATSSNPGSFKGTK